ncbi:MAG: TlpA disulfide reductase family protein [Bacteroidota bacterium]
MKLFKEVVFSSILCFLMVSQAMAQQVTYATVKGQLKGFNNQVQLEDMSEFQYLLPPTAERMIIPDSAGNFTIRFKISGANYYRLGRNALYLSPGDNLEVFIDYSDPRKAVFNGIGAAANNYLKATPFPKGGSFIEAGKQIKETIPETIAAVEELASIRKNELAKVVNITAAFRTLETARIKADLINSLLMGEVYSTMKLKLKDEEAKTFSTAYKSYIAPKIKAYHTNFIDPSLLKLVVYRDIAEELGLNDSQMIKDFYAASEIVSNMQKISDKHLLMPFKQEIAKLKTPKYAIAANKMLTYLMAFGKGDAAVDFVARDLNGQKVSLSNLKGKVIYVDLWATWCGPCMQEMPHYEKLKQRYASNKDVVFVSLSIDDNETLWKGSITQRKAEGYQWLINRAKLQAYNIVGIPRSLLIDKNFKMVDMSAPLPSREAAVKAIDALLK